MAKLTYTKGQLEVVLSELDTGRSVREVSRAHGISLRTLYRWRSNRTAKSVSAKDRLRSLEVKYRRLQKQFAELALDYSTLRAALINDVRRDC